MALLENGGAASTANVSTLVVPTTALSSAPPLNSIIIISGLTGANGSGAVTCPGFSAISGLSTLTLVGGNGGYFFALYKVAGASEPTQYTITPNASNWINAQVNVFTGRNTTSTFTAVNSVNNGSATTTPVSIAVPGVTGAAGDDQIWMGCLNLFNDTTSETLTPPSGFGSILYTHGGGSFSGNYVSCTKINVAGGATGTLTGSIAWTGGNTSYGAGYIISLAAGNYSLAQSPLAFAYTLENANLESLRVLATAGNATRGNPVSATLNAAQSTGVIAVELWGNTNPGTITVTDTVNGAYAQIGTTFYVSGAGYCAAFWVQTTGSGTPVITATNTNSVGSAIGAINITGFIGTPVIDVSGILTASTTSNVGTISQTPASNFNNEVLFATLNDVSYISGAPSGWVNVNNPPFYNIQGAPASVPFNATFGSSTPYAFLSVGIYDSTSPILSANPLSFALTLENATLAAGGALSLAATNLSFAYTLESATLASGSILAAANLAFAYTLEPDNFTYSTANFEFLMAPMTFFVDMGIDVASYQLDFTPLGWQLTLQTNALTFFSNSPFSMPNLVGLLLQEALQVLEENGILVPSAIGYFGTYPITAIWGPGKPSGYVTAQSIAAGQGVVPNSAITLTVNEFRTGVVFPGGGGSIA